MSRTYHTELLDALSDESAVPRAAYLLRRGEPVAFPTETVYGLGACVFNEQAVRGIFLAKGRPSDNPLIVHIADIQDIARVAVNIPPLFGVLASAFFPGPLTVVLDKHEAVPDCVTAGLPGVAVRMPAHPIARSIIRAAGEPLVAPSANRSGRPSPTAAQHVLDDLEGRIAAVVDGGECEIGIESTVVSIREGRLVILRPGAIIQYQLEQATGRQFEVATLQEQGAPAAPGMKYRHYAPQARIAIVYTPEEACARGQGRESVRLLSTIPVECSIERRPLLARTLYAEFRRADADGIREIVVLCDKTVQESAGLMNRIRKAAEG